MSTENLKNPIESGNDGFPVPTGLTAQKEICDRNDQH